MTESDTLSSRDFAFLETLPPDAAAPAPDGTLTRWEQAEKTSLQAELIRLGWNKTATARSLGIAKSTLFEKLKKFGIRMPDPD
jgi:transcriptional regulator of acetoin/glycerol metabolism